MTWIVAGVLGRLAIWALQTSGPSRRLWRLHRLLEELGECDFCLGFWVFLPLVVALDVNVLAPFYLAVVSEVVSAITFSFVVHLVRLGWSLKFGALLVSED